MNKKLRRYEILYKEDRSKSKPERNSVQYRSNMKNKISSQYVRLIEKRKY